MKKSLVILAAGMGQRFGARIKQLEPLGPSGELIIDYSVDYAIKAGFTTVIFIIRKEMDELFRNAVGNRVAEKIETKYVFQQIDDIPDNYNRFKDRTKPWGTAHALYCCRDVISENFAVINADDFYGQSAFDCLGTFLDAPDADGCSIGFVLKNTLSENGTVNRGICKTDSNNFLKSVVETRNITRNKGRIYGVVSGEEVTLDENDIVSMSMWGFTKSFMERLSVNIREFFRELSDDAKSELTIADVVDAEIKSGNISVRNIPTDSKWFGITYQQDVEKVKENLAVFTE